MGVSGSNNHSSSKITPISDFSFDEVLTEKNFKRIKSALPIKMLISTMEIHSTNFLTTEYKKRHSLVKDPNIGHYIYLQCKNGWHLSLQFMISPKKAIPCIRIIINEDVHKVIPEGNKILLRKQINCDFLDILMLGVVKFLSEVESPGVQHKNSQHFANFIYFKSFKGKFNEAK